MYIIIWQFEVPPQSVSEFEEHYGAHGTWARLFKRDPRFKGTRLLRDRTHSSRFLTIDEWENNESYLAFKTEFANEYAQIDADMARLTSRETKVGEFES